MPGRPRVQTPFPSSVQDRIAKREGSRGILLARLIPDVVDRDRSMTPSIAGRATSVALGFRAFRRAAAVAADHVAVSHTHRGMV